MAMAGVLTSIESSSKVWGPPLDLTINGPTMPVIQHTHIPLGDVKTWHTMESGHRCRWWPSPRKHANCDCRVDDINSMTSISVAVHQKRLRTVCGGVWCLLLHHSPLLLTPGRGGCGIWWGCTWEICVDDLCSMFVKPRYWATWSARPCQSPSGTFTNLKWYFVPDHAGSTSYNAYREVQSES